MKEYENKDWLYNEYIVNNNSITEIIKKCKCGRTTLCRRLQKFGLFSIKSNKNNDFKTKEWLKQKYIIDHLTTYQIAKEINVGRSTVCNWLKEFNIPLRDCSSTQFDGSLKGEKHYNWKGGITELHKRIRTCTEYSTWRYDVLKRDRFSCICCKIKGKAGEIEVDHIKPFYLILEENHINAMEDAQRCEELWDINNGRTLCIECHKKETKKLYDTH